MANTPTPNIGLNKPAQGDAPWDVAVNGNMDTIDSCFAGTKLVPAVQATKLLVGATDTGITRAGAGTIAVGNGAPGDASGTIKATTAQLAGLITQYNGLATAGGGVSAVMSPVTLQKTETAADASLLSFTPPAVAGTYRVSFILSVSAAASAVLGWTVTWRDPNATTQIPTNMPLFQIGGGSAAPALTFTTSATGDYYGDARIDTDNSAFSIVVKFTLTSGTITAKATAIIERLI